MGLFSSSSDDEEDVDRGGFDDGGKISNVGRRVIDEEAEVVIYAVKYNRSGGNSGYGTAAVPLSDTELEIEDEDDENPDED